MNKTFHIIASLFVAMLLLSGESWAEDKQPSPVINEEYEMDSWTSAKEINTIEAYEVYLAEYANGRHAKFAQAAINKIKKAENPKGSEESGLPRAKDAGDGAAKQPAAAASPVPAVVTTPPVATTPAVTEMPAAVAPKSAIVPATSSGDTSTGTGEKAPKP